MCLPNNFGFTILKYIHAMFVAQLEFDIGCLYILKNRLETHAAEYIWVFGKCQFQNRTLDS